MPSSRTRKAHRAAQKTAQAAPVIGITVTPVEKVEAPVKETSKFALAIRAGIEKADRVAMGTARVSGVVVGTVGLGRPAAWILRKNIALSEAALSGIAQVAESKVARKAAKAPVKAERPWYIHETYVDAAPNARGKHASEAAWVLNFG